MLSNANEVFKWVHCTCQGFAVIQIKVEESESCAQLKDPAQYSQTYHMCVS